MTINDFLSQRHDSRATVPVYTSGSTGKPKLMMAEKVRMEASARMTCKALGLKAGDKALVCLPMDYIAGKMMVVRSLVCDLQMISIEPKGHPMADVADDEEIDFAAVGGGHISPGTFALLNVGEGVDVVVAATAYAGTEEDGAVGQFFTLGLVAARSRTVVDGAQHVPGSAHGRERGAGLR